MMSLGMSVFTWFMTFLYFLHGRRVDRAEKRAEMKRRCLQERADRAAEWASRLQEFNKLSAVSFFFDMFDTCKMGAGAKLRRSVLSADYNRPLRCSLPPNVDVQRNQEALFFMRVLDGASWVHRNQQETDMEDKWQTCVEAFKDNPNLKHWPVAAADDRVFSYSANFVRALCADDRNNSFGAPSFLPMSDDVLLYLQVVNHVLQGIQRVFTTFPSNAGNDGCQYGCCKTQVDVAVDAMKADVEFMDLLSVFLKPIRFTLPADANVVDAGDCKKFTYEELCDWNNAKSQERKANDPFKYEHYKCYMFLGWAQYLQQEKFKNVLVLLRTVFPAERFDDTDRLDFDVDDPRWASRCVKSKVRVFIVRPAI